MIPFGTQDWLLEINAELKNIAYWLRKSRQNKVPNFVYSTIGGIALWPLFKALKQDVTYWDIVPTIYDLLDNNISSQFAKELYSWQSQELQHPHELIKQVSNKLHDENFRLALDQIITQLNILSEIKTILPQRSFDGLLQTFHIELASLNHLDRFIRNTNTHSDQEISAPSTSSFTNNTFQESSPVKSTDQTIENYNAPPQKQTPIHIYTNHVIAQNRYLQLQGIRSGGRLVHIELEKIYITLKTIQEKRTQIETLWLENESSRAPGEQKDESQSTTIETITLSVDEAIDNHQHLVILGDPGSGKTTLLRYLALEYAKDFHTNSVPQKKQLPILIHLRKLGAYLAAQFPQDEGVDGPNILLSYLQKQLENERLIALETAFTGHNETSSLKQIRLQIEQYYNNEDLLTLCFDLNIDFDNIAGTTKSGKVRELIALMRRQGLIAKLIQALKANRPNVNWTEISWEILNELPIDFFEEYLHNGQAIILLDGLDEVSNSKYRRRLSRIIESFSRIYAKCQYIVTSRIVGYTGSARLGEGFIITTIQNFSLNDVNLFLTHWHKMVAIGQMGPGKSADLFASEQTSQLMSAIRINGRIRELAINPLMLTVIALVHRDRVKLPDRRAELYAEAVDVLLGKWDEARGVVESSIFEDKPFDAGDKRLVLQSIALHMHLNEQKDIEIDTIKRLLLRLLVETTADKKEATRAAHQFLKVIEERTGLLTARGDGIYAFSHLTFQEYLTALAIAGKDDYINFTLNQAPDPWWREVILLEAGFISTQSKEKTTRLINAIANHPKEREPFDNIVLAIECIKDVGSNRVNINLEKQLRDRLRSELEKSDNRGFAVQKWFGFSSEKPNAKRLAAAKALAHLGERKFWSARNGEPEWIKIPEGPFSLGSKHGYPHEQPKHRLNLKAFSIARVPITNAQYSHYIKANDISPPTYWLYEQPSREIENHPVIVDFQEAWGYCKWLAQATGKNISLPSEAEWEKAARGAKDEREFPWGDTFDHTLCNCGTLALATTTPVGIFPKGSSPDGILDMSGNVWEWTRTLWGTQEKEAQFKYPYKTEDGREYNDRMNLSFTLAKYLFIIRGGSYANEAAWCRCSARNRIHMSIKQAVGFRPVFYE